MIEQSHRPLTPSGTGELDRLQQRANAQRYRHHSARTLDRWQNTRANIGSPIRSINRLPARFLLHAVVALVLPLAVALSQVQPKVLLPEQQSAMPLDNGDFTVPVSPLSLDGHTHVGDAPLTDEGELPMPLSLTSRSAALAPVVVPATVAGDRILLRNGPGTNYDAVGRMSSGTPIQVIGRRDDWYEVRESVDKPVYWVAGELLNLPDSAIYTLFEVQDSDVPPPPPPKVGQVNETGLQLRDGPGTNYVPLAKLNAGVQVDLLERYQDWYHIGVPGGADGWVKSQYVNTDGNMINRLLEAEAIPDANPAMVGVIVESAVNLRQGPDSKYPKVAGVAKGTQVDLIGKNGDWYKVKLPGGSVAWVFNDFLSASAHVARRVPVTKDFPALPARPKVTLASRSGTTASRTGGSRVSGPDVSSIPASGDVASYAVQFSGSRYVWGGASPSGFDCSGLTMYVYRKFGVSLPHSAAGQFSGRYGAIIRSMDQLAPGDLVFFANTAGPGITHVALYIGGGRVIHAMTPRMGVQVSDITSSYWIKHYYGGLRVSR
jgi:cell wall-associated NlpC family hydrolase